LGDIEIFIRQAAEASEVSNRNEIMMNKIIKTKEQDKSVRIFLWSQSLIFFK